MSLIKCPDCAKDVSSKAPACPGCGRPLAPPAPPAPVAMPAPKQVESGADTNWMGWIAGLIICLLILGQVSKVSSSRRLGPQPATRIQYRIVEEWAIPNGGFGRAIVIDQKDRGEESLRKLGETLKYDTGADRNAFVWIYDDERASKMRRNVPPEGSKDGRFYDAHFVGDYSRNINTGFHRLACFREGGKRPIVEVKY